MNRFNGWYMQYVDALTWLPLEDLLEGERVCKGVYSLARYHKVWQSLFLRGEESRENSINRLFPLPRATEGERDPMAEQLRWKRAVLLLDKEVKHFYYSAHPEPPDANEPVYGQTRAACLVWRIREETFRAPQTEEEGEAAENSSAPSTIFTPLVAQCDGMEFRLFLCLDYADKQQRAGANQTGGVNPANFQPDEVGIYLHYRHHPSVQLRSNKYVSFSFSAFSNELMRKVHEKEPNQQGCTTTAFRPRGNPMGWRIPRPLFQTQNSALIKEQDENVTLEETPAVDDHEKEPTDENEEEETNHWTEGQKMIKRQRIHNSDFLFRLELFIHPDEEEYAHGGYSAYNHVLASKYYSNRFKTDVFGYLSEFARMSNSKMRKQMQRLSLKSLADYVMDNSMPIELRVVATGTLWNIMDTHDFACGEKTLSHVCGSMLKLLDYSEKNLKDSGELQRQAFAVALGGLWNIPSLPQYRRELAKQDVFLRTSVVRILHSPQSRPTELFPASHILSSLLGRGYLHDDQSSVSIDGISSLSGFLKLAIDRLQAANLRDSSEFGVAIQTRDCADFFIPLLCSKNKQCVRFASFALKLFYHSVHDEDAFLFHGTDETDETITDHNEDDEGGEEQSDHGSNSTNPDESTEHLED